MRRICCWCQKDLGEKMPFEVEGVTGGACDPCATVLMGDIRRETGWAYYMVLSRGCSHLLEDVGRLLKSWPHLKIVVDRRYTPATHATPPSIYPDLGKTLPIPPRPYHLVIRRDCAHLYGDLLPLFSGRSDIRVLVDRRTRSRTPSPSELPPSQRRRHGDPPAWIV